MWLSNNTDVTIVAYLLCSVYVWFKTDDAQPAI